MDEADFISFVNFTKKNKEIKLSLIYLFWDFYSLNTSSEDARGLTTGRAIKINQTRFFK